MERVATCLLLFVFKNTYHVHEQPINVIQTWRNKRYTYKDIFKENADAFVRRMQIESETVSRPLLMPILHRFLCKMLAINHPSFIL